MATSVLMSHTVSTPLPAPVTTGCHGYHPSNVRPSLLNVLHAAPRVLMDPQSVDHHQSASAAFMPEPSVCFIDALTAAEGCHKSSHYGIKSTEHCGQMVLAVLHCGADGQLLQSIPWFLLLLQRKAISW